MIKGKVRCNCFTVLASKRERVAESCSVASLHVRNCCCFPFYPAFVPLFLFLCSTSPFPLFHFSFSFVLSFLSFLLFDPSFRISFVRSAFHFVPSLSFFLSFFLSDLSLCSVFLSCPSLSSTLPSFVLSFALFDLSFLPSFLPSSLPYSLHGCSFFLVFSYLSL